MPAKLKDQLTDPLNLNPCRLNFVAQFQSAGETRYYLNGVHVEPHPTGGAVMVATDGHRMAIAHDPGGACPSPVTIVTKSAGTIFKPGAALRDQMRVEFTSIEGLDANQLLATRSNAKGESDQTGIVNLIDGKFPDWRKAVPWELLDAENQFSGTFNADYLKSFGARFMGNSAPIAIRQKSGTDSALICRDDLPWFLGVLMPTRRAEMISDEIRALAPSPEAA